MQCPGVTLQRSSADGLNESPRLKATGSKGIDFLRDLIISVVKHGKIPEDWEMSFILNLYKGKGDALNRGTQLAMRRRATSSQRWHPLPRSRSHTQRRADVGSRSQAAQSATKLCSADLLGSGLSLCWHHRWIVGKAIPARWQKSEN